MYLHGIQNLLLARRTATKITKLTEGCFLSNVVHIRDVQGGMHCYSCPESHEFQIDAPVTGRP